MTLMLWMVGSLLVLGALLFVLPPLMHPSMPARDGASPLAAYREQRAQLDTELAEGSVSAQAHARGIAELQDRVADEVGETADVPGRYASPGSQARLAGVASVALLLPAGVLALYALLGQPAALKPYGIDGTVVVQESLRPRVAEGATLFVFARPVEGARAPVAILRVPAGEFPQRFRLDDSLAMAPDRVLSSHGTVTLGARISSAGDATPRPGDLIGTLGPVRYGASGVRLVIDGALP